MAPLFPRIPAWALGLIAFLFVINAAFVYTLTFGTSRSSYVRVPSLRESITFIQDSIQETIHSHSEHPIDDLLKWSREDFQAALANRTYGTSAAAKAYRERRGRHPPPGFDKWVEYAEAHGAIIVENFWDRIYDDLEPFWGVGPWVIRDLSKKWTGIVTVRKGAASLRMPIDDKATGQARWRANARAPYVLEMVKDIESFLPDVDLAIAGTAEPNIVARYEQVAEALRYSRETKKMAPADGTDFMLNYPTWPPLADRYSPPVNEYAEWRKTDQEIAQWYFTREACETVSYARQIDITDYSGDVSVSEFPSGWPKGSFDGYVRNWTFARSVCDNPHLRNLHGAFIAPSNKANRVELFPLFGDSGVFDVNNEITMPSVTYWNALADWPDFSLPNVSVPWDEKHNVLRWHDDAKGGIHDEQNWQRFPRFRLLSMLNSTHITNAEDPLAKVPHNFPFPNETAYPLKAVEETGLPSMLGEWVDSFGEVGLTGYRCHPLDGSANGNRCSYLQSHYKLQTQEPLEDMFSAKYLVDVDGDGISTRYLAYLLSNSLPIKATVYKEWHDSRLWPWVHFVPMDNTFVDLYGIMQYFLGHEKGAKSHDDAARKIAQEGAEWSSKVLRREDMTIYMYRLILEFARVSTDRRLKMAYLGDLRT